MMGVADETTMPEENDTSMLDTISEDVVTGYNVGRSVGRPTPDSTEVSRLAEDNITPLRLPSALDGVSAGVGTEDSGSVIDADIVTLSEGVSRGVLTSTEAVSVAEVKGREVKISSLEIDDGATGRSEDEV
jgi:hypothetical protein